MEALNLKRFRESKGYSQERLGDLVGASRTYISQLETGSRGISKKMREKLCEVLGVSPAEFFEGKAKTPEELTDDPLLRAFLAEVKEKFRGLSSLEEKSEKISKMLKAWREE